MKVVVAVALFFAVACRGQQNCPAASDRNCNLQVLQCCDGNFQDALNLTAACGNQQTFQDPNCMRMNIERLYALGGVNGLLKVCSAFNIYDNCLGMSEDRCTSALFFIQQGFKKFQAEEFVRLFQSFHFACGGGLNSYLQHDQCMAGVFMNSRDALRQCREQFIYDIESNPQMACQYLDNLIHCIQNPFVNACGGEAGYWACEYERTAASVFLPQCTNRCGMTQTGTIG